MSLDLNQAVLGLQALSVGVTNELFKLRQELEIQQREMQKASNEIMGKTAVAQANATYESTELDAESTKQRAIGDLTGNIANAAAQGVGTMKGKSFNDSATEANSRADALKAQITDKEAQLTQARAAVVANGAAPAEAGAVGNHAELQKDLDDLRAQHKQAVDDAHHHENMMAQTRTQFQAVGSAAVGGVQGSTGIAAAASLSDKAQQDAAAVLMQYMLQVLKTVADSLSSMAQSQESAIQGVGQMLTSLTNANHVSA